MKKSVGIALTAVFLLLSATFLLFADSGGRLTSAITIPPPPSPFEAASATQPIEIPPPPDPFAPAASTEPELPPPPDPLAPPAPSASTAPGGGSGGGGTGGSGSGGGGGGGGGGGRGGGGSRGIPRNQTIPIVPPPTTAQPAPQQPPLTPGFVPPPTTPFEPEPFTPTPEPQPAPQPYIPPAPEIEIPEEGTAWWWILLIIILILIILLIVFLIWKHYRDKKERLAKLKGYILICLKQGFKPEEIKAKLLRYGWNEKEVDDMMKEVLAQLDKPEGFASSSKTRGFREIEEEKRRTQQGKPTLYSGMYGGINSAGNTVSRTRSLTQQQKPVRKPNLGMKK